MSQPHANIIHVIPRYTTKANYSAKRNNMNDIKFLIYVIINCVY